MKHYKRRTPRRRYAGHGNRRAFGHAYGGADTVNQYPGSFSSGANDGPVLTVQAPCNKCVSVIVDSVQLKENADYIKKCGSTIITFTPSYLATLQNGTHSIRVLFTDGRYDGTFITPFAAQLTTASMPDVPATGGAPWWVLAPLAMIGAAYCFGGNAYKGNDNVS